MSLHTHLLPLTLALLLAPASAANSGFSNLSPTGTYNSTDGAFISGNNLIETSIAVPFTVTDSSRLASFELAIENSTGSDKVAVYLQEDSGGLPGAVIEDLGIHIAHKNITSNSELVTVPSVAAPLLSPGTQYWAVCRPGLANTFVKWSDNNQGVDDFAYTYDNSPWMLYLASAQGAMRVNTTPVVVGELATTLSPAGTYNANNSYSITGLSGFESWQASSFSVETSTRLHSLELALRGGISNDTVRVELCADAGGTPGALIEDLGSHSGLPFNSNSVLQTSVSVDRPLLAAGITYWVVCSPAASSTVAGWNRNNQGQQGPVATFDGTTWSTTTGALPALRVLGEVGVWSTYCTAGISASGCQATLSATGVPCASASTGFVVSATGVEGAKDGLFFFGTNGRQANSWGNGSSFQCVVPPVKRAGLQLAATGSTVGACDGAFSQDLHAMWSAQPQKNPGSGAVVQLQLWYRDPQNTSNQTTSLSDALEFTVQP